MKANLDQRTKMISHMNKTQGFVYDISNLCPESTSVSSQHSMVGWRREGSESRQQQVAPFPGGIQEMGNGRRAAAEVQRKGKRE